MGGGACNSILLRYFIGAADRSFCPLPIAHQRLSGLISYWEDRAWRRMRMRMEETKGKTRAAPSEGCVELFCPLQLVHYYGSLIIAVSLMAGVGGTCLALELMRDKKIAARGSRRGKAEVVRDGMSRWHYTGLILIVPFCAEQFVMRIITY